MYSFHIKAIQSAPLMRFGLLHHYKVVEKSQFLYKQNFFCSLGSRAKQDKAHHRGRTKAILVIVEVAIEEQRRIATAIGTNG
jgi:hypothetical protein